MRNPSSIPSLHEFCSQTNLHMSIAVFCSLVSTTFTHAQHMWHQYMQSNAP